MDRIQKIQDYNSEAKQIKLAHFLVILLAVYFETDQAFLWIFLGMIIFFLIEIFYLVVRMNVNQEFELERIEKDKQA